MFMPARGTGQGAPFHRIRDRHPPEAEEPFPHSLDALAGPEGGHLLFALRVLLPEVHITAETGDRGGVTAWLHDGHSSWATVDSRHGPGSAAVVYQGGPRRLVDKLLEVWEQWESRGAPGLYDFGLTPHRTRAVGLERRPRRPPLAATGLRGSALTSAVGPAVVWRPRGPRCAVRLLHGVDLLQPPAGRRLRLQPPEPSASSPPRRHCSCSPSWRQPSVSASSPK